MPAWVVEAHVQVIVNADDEAEALAAGEETLANVCMEVSDLAVAKY